MSSKDDVKGLILVGLASSAGSSVGGELRAFVMDQREARRCREQGLPEPERRVYLQTLGDGAIASTTIAATFLALRLKQRRVAGAFLIALLLTLLVGDRFDRALCITLNQPGD